MVGYFENFPKVKYRLSVNTGTGYLNVTNIMVRTGLRKDILNSSRVYYDYIVPEHMNQETIANEYYGDSNRHWIVMYSNNVVDPFYDWILTPNDFEEYIISKYGSMEIAKTTIKEYYKTVQKIDSETGKITEFTYIIDENTYDSLPDLDTRNITLQNGFGLEINITRSFKYAYDWELEQNEKKRNIKLIDKRYTGQLENEHEDLLKNDGK